MAYPRPELSGLCGFRVLSSSGWRCAFLTSRRSTSRRSFQRPSLFADQRPRRRVSHGWRARQCNSKGESLNFDNISARSLNPTVRALSTYFRRSSTQPRRFGELYRLCTYAKVCIFGFCQSSSPACNAFGQHYISDEFHHLWTGLDVGVRQVLGRFQHGVCIRAWSSWTIDRRCLLRPPPNANWSGRYWSLRRCHREDASSLS